MDLDAADTAFIESLTPDGHLCTGFIAVLSFIRPDGTPGWTHYYQHEGLAGATVIGMLEMAKAEILDVVRTENDEGDG